MMYDWRLMGQEEYLYGMNFKKHKYNEKEEGCDHTHCEFCWCKFMEIKSSDGDICRDGYKSENGGYWICNKCFNDFKDRFNWNEV